MDKKIKFIVERNSNKLLSSKESLLSDDVKAFRKIAYKMNVGDSIIINSIQRNKFQNFLRFRNLTNRFKSRLISKSDDTLMFYCVKKINKSELL